MLVATGQELRLILQDLKRHTALTLTRLAPRLPFIVVAAPLTLARVGVAVRATRDTITDTGRPRGREKGKGKRRKRDSSRNLQRPTNTNTTIRRRKGNTVIHLPCLRRMWAWPREWPQMGY